jgi:hypothetical protein
LVKLTMMMIWCLMQMVQMKKTIKNKKKTRNWF